MSKKIRKDAENEKKIVELTQFIKKLSKLLQIVLIVIRGSTTLVLVDQVCLRGFYGITLEKKKFNLE